MTLHDIALSRAKHLRTVQQAHKRVKYFLQKMEKTQPNHFFKTIKAACKPLKRFTGRLFHLHSNQIPFSVLALPIRGYHASLHLFAPK